MSLFKKGGKFQKNPELSISIEENSIDCEYDELNDEIDKILNNQKILIDEKRESESKNSSLNTTPTPNPIRTSQTFSYNLSKIKDFNQNFFALTWNKNDKFHYLKKNNNLQYSLTPIEMNKLYYFNQNFENNNNYIGFYATPKLNSNYQLNIINNNNQFLNQFHSINHNLFQNNFHCQNNFNINNNKNKYFSVNVNNVTPSNQKANDEIMLNNMKNKYKKNNKISKNNIKRKTSQNLQDEDKEHNIIDINLIIQGKDKRTTLMIKNIPNKYTINTFLDEINVEFKNKYDLFYLPIDYGNKSNLGYAFINFVDSFHIIYFYDLYRGKKWKRFNSEKTCELLYAKIQGKKDLILHFEKGKVLSFDSEDKRPLILPTPNPLPNIEIPIKFYEKFKFFYPYAHFIYENNDNKENKKFIFNSEYLMYEK